MDDPVLVSRLEPVCNLTRDGEHLVDREWGTLQFLREHLEGTSSMTR